MSLLSYQRSLRRGGLPDGWLDTLASPNSDGRPCLGQTDL
jgi:hypothetical protein